MRLVGVLLWAVFLLLALLLYAKEEQRRLSEYRGLCRLVSHLRDTLSEMPLPLCEIYASFSDDALARAGFLAHLKERGLPFALDSGVLHLSAEELTPFQAYAEALGGRLYAEERARAEALLSRVTATLSQKTLDAPRKKKLASTLFFTGGMLLLLLLI